MIEVYHATGFTTLLEAVRDYAAKRDARDANRALREARERAADFPPFGCRWCGLARTAPHYGRWANQPGWHTYTPPTTDQIKTRMLARRYGSTQTTKTEG